MGIDPVTTTILAGASLYMQYEQGEEAKKRAAEARDAQTKSMQIQGKQAEVEAQRARLAQVREARIRQAQILSTAGQAGFESSGIAGASSSVAAQEGANIGFINQTQTFSQAATAANIQAAHAQYGAQVAQQNAAQWQTLSTIFMPTKAEFASIFSKKPISGVNG